MNHATTYKIYGRPPSCEELGVLQKNGETFGGLLSAILNYIPEAAGGNPELDSEVLRGVDILIW
jgi:hypothetical protein